jgi:hypothetical protein
VVPIAVPARRKLTVYLDAQAAFERMKKTLLGDGGEDFKRWLNLNCGATAIERHLVFFFLPR